MGKCASDRGVDLPYHTKAVIKNVERSGEKAHYVCYTKKGDDWWKCDDETVKRVDVKEVEGRNGHECLVFLQRS